MTTSPTTTTTTTLPNGAVADRDGLEAWKADLIALKRQGLERLRQARAAGRARAEKDCRGAIRKIDNALMDVECTLALLAAEPEGHA
jgi:hypothetical protein